MKPEALALMEATSFCAGVRRKRYSGKQETAPSDNMHRRLCCFKQNYHFF